MSYFYKVVFHDIPCRHRHKNEKTALKCAKKIIPKDQHNNLYLYIRKYSSNGIRVGG